MNNYQRLEINLLPPEMAPGPAVRFSSIASIFVIVTALGLVGGMYFTELGRINGLKKTNEKQKQEIISKQPTIETFKALNEIKENTEGRGKLVGMASASYVEFPIILDRVSRLLPDGVHLVKTASGGGGGRGSSKEIILNFRTSNGNPELMSRTLEAFKTSNLFADSYLRSGDLRPGPLEELTDKFGIPYRYDGPGAEQAVVNSYDFEIRAMVNSPLEIDDLGTVLDKSELFKEFELKTDPSAQPAPEAPPAGGAGAPAAGGAPPAGTPAAPAAGGAAPAAGGAG